MAIDVQIAREVDFELVESINLLVPQLTSRPVRVSEADVAAIVQSESTVLFVARDDGVIVGVASLAIYRVPTGLKAWIEDVVVDEGSRGLGVGEALTAAALSEARHRGLPAVDLTSRPNREAAHRLYEKLGFVTRETGVYRKNL